MKRLLTAALLLLSVAVASAQVPRRISIPDIEGFHTLKADLHVHTMFSDGSVWPTNRVDEAYMEGLDVIAVTDHLEMSLFRQYTGGILNKKKVDRNTAYELASSYAANAYPACNMIVLRGGEVSRGMPPGHFNAIGTTDTEAIAKISDKYGDHLEGDHVKAMVEALKLAKKQGAYLQWNHPDWAGGPWDKQAQNITEWHPEHTMLYDMGLMQGIEIYNGRYCPEAFGWAVEKGLTITAGTDVHSPIYMEVDFNSGELRPITLVFAEEKTESSVKDALMNQRTAVFADGYVYGAEKWLTALLDASVGISEVKAVDINARDHKRIITWKFINRSSIPVSLVKAPGVEDLMFSRTLVLHPGEERNFTTTLHNDSDTSVDIPFQVVNFLTAPDTPLVYTIHLSAE